jgi:hypothetical protein
MSQKEPLNELGLLAILGTIAFFGFITMFFSKLADNVDAYYHGRDPKLQKALQKITNNLAKSDSFIDRINKKVPQTGIGSKLVSAVMTFPELVFMYENKKGIEKISIPL